MNQKMGVVDILLLVLGVSGQLLAQICPPDWHRYGESCYFVITQTMDWYEANRTCAISQANLAIPNSQFEHDFIWQLFRQEVGHSYSLWIGCNDIEEEGKWQHCPLNGEPNAYENWKTGEPNDSPSPSDCAALWEGAGGLWDDQKCDWNGNYALCELPVINTPVFCLQTGNDGRITSQCLFNHVMKEQAGNGIVSCGKACRSDLRCRSFNLLEQEGGKMVCQLNNATRHEAAEGEMKEEENCYFFDL